MYAIEADKSFLVDRIDNEVIIIMVETGITLGISRSSRLGPPTDMRCVAYVGTYNSTNILAVGRLRNHLIQLANANHKDCHFKFQNYSFLKCKNYKNPK